MASPSSTRSTHSLAGTVNDPSQTDNTKTMERSTIQPSTSAISQSPISSLDINREILKEVAKIYSPPEVCQSTLATTKKPKSRRRSASSSDHGVSSIHDLHHLSNTKVQPVGLRRIGQLVKQPVSMGHHKAAVMVIGNISAGKSTFINWYVQEAVQKTGMAIETSGFTYITGGRCVTEIGGESTLTLRPQLQKLTAKYKGFLENLSLKTCPSRDGRLHLVDLIDTPGLADGELQYPFDVEEVIFEMRHFVDLFFVFFDPIGQALGKRMLSVVKKLNDSCPDKVRFCLTKVDEVRTEEERIKVMCQTTQSLTAKISSRHGFDLVPIYIPGAKDGKYLSFSQSSLNESFGTPQVVNRLKDLIEDINRVTERRIQDALNTLLADVNKLSIAVDKKVNDYSNIESDIARQHSQSRRYTFWRIIILFFASIFAILQLKSVPKLAPSVIATIDDAVSFIDPMGVEYLNVFVRYLASIPHLFVTVWAILALAFLSTISFKSPPKISLSYQNEYSQILESHEFLNMAKLRWKQLNHLYLDHSMNDSTESSSE